MRRLVSAGVLLIALLAIAVAGCGSSSDDSSGTTSASASKQGSAESTSQIKPTAGGRVENLHNEQRGVTFGAAEPGIPKPVGPPPTELVKRAFIPGDGKAAADGDDVTVQFVGFNYRTGKKFNSTWDAGRPLTFKLGAKEAIPGWEKGVIGMRENGRYELIVPPDLAFGSEGSPPAIKPNETLVYLIDIASVN